MKLYIYDHCPYCTKARMIFGLTGTKPELATLHNDDEATPTKMIGKKMVPILQKDDGSYMAESMDIVFYIDRLQPESIFTGTTRPDVTLWLAGILEVLYPLCMPRWAKAPLPEFTRQSARDYFIETKEARIGSFDEHLANSDMLKQEANEWLDELGMLVKNEKAINGALSLDDIHVFAALRSLSIVKGLEYNPMLEAYRQEMSRLSRVPLHDAIAID